MIPVALPVLPSSFVESPENHALVRAALEQALREFIFLSKTITGNARREHFVAYLEGRFGLDHELVAKVPLVAQVAA